MGSTVFAGCGIVFSIAGLFAFLMTWYSYLVHKAGVRSSLWMAIASLSLMQVGCMMVIYSKDLVGEISRPF